jgi:acyl dehydratase
MKNDEFQIGGAVEITQDLLKAYSVPSGDFNPIHLNNSAAREMGLRAPIAHGMLLMGLANREALEWQKKFSEITSWQIAHFETRFMSPVFVGDKIFFKARIQSQGDLELTLSIKTYSFDPTTESTESATQVCQGTIRLIPEIS